MAMAALFHFATLTLWTIAIMWTISMASSENSTRNELSIRLVRETYGQSSITVIYPQDNDLDDETLRGLNVALQTDAGPIQIRVGLDDGDGSYNQDGIVLLMLPVLRDKFRDIPGRV